jgi:hypothetical protein
MQTQAEMQAPLREPTVPAPQPSKDKEPPQKKLKTKVETDADNVAGVALEALKKAKQNLKAVLLRAESFSRTVLGKVLDEGPELKKKALAKFKPGVVEPLWQHFNAKASEVEAMAQDLKKTSIAMKHQDEKIKIKKKKKY